MWALGELNARQRNQATASAERENIARAIASSVGQDKFWAMRLEAATALQDDRGDVARTALLAAVKDSHPLVRARAIRTLGALKDPSLVGTFQNSLSDQSYGVIRAAAEALGLTKDPGAYESLAKLLDTPSWRDNLRVAGLNGLATLGDKRSLEAGIQYAVTGNRANVRAAAIGILGTAGKGDPRAFPLISDALLKSAAPLNFTLLAAAGRALLDLGDPRGVEVLEQAIAKLSSTRSKILLQQLAEMLKQKSH
jgi:aminopeptidase N